MEGNNLILKNKTRLRFKNKADKILQQTDDTIIVKRESGKIETLKYIDGHWKRIKNMHVKSTIENIDGKIKINKQVKRKICVNISSKQFEKIQQIKSSTGITFSQIVETALELALSKVEINENK